MLQFVFFKLFYILLGFVLFFVYIASSNTSLVKKDSQKLLETSTTNNSTQRDPEGSPNHPKENKPNKFSKKEDNNIMKSPHLPTYSS